MTQAPAEEEHNPWLVGFVVSLAAFMEVLDTTITNVSLNHIAGTLGASQDESTWIITSYLVANGIVLPLSGWLSAVLGRKRFFMLCIATFTATSFACGMSTSLTMLIAFRLLQGLSGGGLQPVQQAIILDAFPPQMRGAAFGITGVTMIVAPILGPTLGGYITDNFSWQWIFFMNVPVGIFALIMVARVVEDPPHARAHWTGAIDYIGLLLIAIGLGSLQVVLDKGQQEDWFGSSFIIFFASASAICLISAIAWLQRQKDPVVDLRLLSIPTFGLSFIMMFFVGASLYAGATLLPILTQSEFGFDATLAGLVLSPSGIAVIFLMPIAGRLVNKVQARYLIAAGMLLCSIGMFMTMRISPQTDYASFVFMRIMQVIGLPFLFIPTSALAFSRIPKEKSSKASAIFAMARNLGGSIGIAIMAGYVVRHEQIHQSYLVNHLSSSDIGYRTALSHHVNSALAHGHSLAGATGGAIRRIYGQLAHQADIMAFDDGFAVVGVTMATLAILALFMPDNNPRRQLDPEVVAH